MTRDMAMAPSLTPIAPRLMGSRDANDVKNRTNTRSEKKNGMIEPAHEEMQAQHHEAVKYDGDREKLAIHGPGDFRQNGQAAPRELPHSCHDFILGFSCRNQQESKGGQGYRQYGNHKSSGTEHG